MLDRKGVKIALKVATEDGKVWPYETRSPGKWPETPVHQLLRWIVEQLRFNNFDYETDDKDEVVSILIGKAAASPEGTPPEEIEYFAQMSILAVHAAGVFAKAREQGLEPESADVAEQATATADHGAYQNTEVFYAFQLLDILQRIRERCFLLDYPPISGRAPEDAVRLLGEATRCHLFGLHRACISLCRACMEDCLRDKVPWSEVLQERLNSSKAGELETLINAALRLKLLDGPQHQMAHEVRKTGNRVMHGKGHGGKEDSWDVLRNTRTVVSSLFE